MKNKRILSFIIMLALVTSCMSPVFAADRPADTVTASEITIGSDGSLSLEELRQAAKEELAKIDLSDFSDDLPVRHLLENAIENARADIEKAREESEIRKTLESVRTLIEERKAEVAAVDDEDMISAGEAWIHTEEIHLSWYEAQIEFAESGKESTKQ